MKEIGIKKIKCPKCGATDRFVFDEKNLTVFCYYCEMVFTLNKFIPDYEKIENILNQSGSEITDRIRVTMLDVIKENINAPMQAFLDDMKSALKYAHKINVDFSPLQEQLEQIARDTKTTLDTATRTNEILAELSRKMGNSDLDKLVDSGVDSYSFQ
ncbi:MAG: hypothetical protein FWD49_02465 [Firmicutes bacterium]|nr:hypothetical protein [Bacillota bacterium]